MLKRIFWAGMLCGIMAGCQTPRTMDAEQTDAHEVAGMAETNAPASPPVAPPPPEKMANEPEIQAEQTTEQERNRTMILMKTSLGDITLELDREKAPKTVDNFLSYVESGHYEGTIFHRVINGFMIQGGGFDASMQQKPAPRTVENEAKNGLSNAVGTIAMARTPDPHSASAQFFINVNNNDNLDYPSFDGWGYCVFGKVVEGMDVVNQIKEVPTRSVGPHADVPVDPIVIQFVTVTDG